MNILYERHITIESFFGLTRLCELNGIERRNLSPAEGDTQILYLFRCDDLLLAGYKLVIDEQRGMVGMDLDGALLMKTGFNRLEIFFLIALILSFQFTVGQTQIKKLIDMHENYEKNEKYKENELIMCSIREFALACNDRLRSLGLEIETIGLRVMSEKTVESTEVDHSMCCIPDLVMSCNEKIRPLGLEIKIIEDACQLIKGADVQKIEELLFDERDLKIAT